MVMPVHCRTYIHFDGARKPENRKNIRGRLMIVFISALDYGCVCFVWGSFQSGSRYSALGNGKRWQCFWGLVWRVSGKNGEEQMRGIFRSVEAFAREFVFLGYLSLTGKDFTGTESKALGKCPPSTHGYGVCFHFRQWLVRYPGRRSKVRRCSITFCLEPESGDLSSLVEGALACWKRT